MQLTGDKMSLGGSVASAVIKLDAYSSDKTINLGAGAADSASVLGLTDTELKTLHGAHLRIGTVAGYTGSNVVTGTLSLAGSTAGSTDLTLSGGAVTVQGGLTALSGVNLFSTGGDVSGTGAITASDLNATAQTVALTGANAAGVIHGSSSVGDFSYTSAGAMTTGVISGATGVVLSAGGNITQNDMLTAPRLTVSTPGTATLDNASNHIDALSATNIGTLSVTSLNPMTLGWTGHGISQASGSGYLQFNSSATLGSGITLSGNDIRFPRRQGQPGRRHRHRHRHRAPSSASNRGRASMSARAPISSTPSPWRSATTRSRPSTMPMSASAA